MPDPDQQQDQSQSDGIGKVLAATDGAVAQAAMNQAKKPPFRTHSDAVAGEAAAKMESINAMVQAVDAKIADLNLERTDLMLAWSMLSAGFTARDKGGA